MPIKMMIPTSASGGPLAAGTRPSPLAVPCSLLDKLGL